MTNNNIGCMVSLDEYRERRAEPMAKARKKTDSKVAIPGPDGKTIGQRLWEAIAFHQRTLNRDYSPQDLFRDVNKMLGANPEFPRISQQSISKILIPESKVSSSKNSVYFAQVLGVNHVWLASGIGSKTKKD
jgi:hypothetical protein